LLELLFFLRIARFRSWRLLRYFRGVVFFILKTYIYVDIPVLFEFTLRLIPIQPFTHNLSHHAATSRLEEAPFGIVYRRTRLLPPFNSIHRILILPLHFEHLSLCILFRDVLCVGLIMIQKAVLPVDKKTGRYFLTSIRLGY